jgi:hypothetical protein
MDDEPDETKFRVRLRFRVAKRLNLQALSHEFAVAGSGVTLSADEPDKTIFHSNWLVMNSRGFDTEGDATRFAERLKFAMVIASLRCRFGVDVGVDQATTRTSQTVKDLARDQSGVIYRDNIHGIDVFPDSAAVRFPKITAEGTVHAAPEAIIENVSRLGETLPASLPANPNALLLLNAALMNGEPLAQLVLAVSAVEMLAGDEQWSVPQRELLKVLVAKANKTRDVSTNERVEVVDAIRRAFRVSVRQGIRRILTRLGLSSLWKDWDNLYGDRSALFHGARTMSSSEHHELAQKAITICARIVLTALATEIPGVADDIDLFFPLHHAANPAVLALVRDEAGESSPSCGLRSAMPTRSRRSGSLPAT